MPSTATRMPPRRASQPEASTRGSVRPMLVVWIAWVVLMAGVNLPTPLYAVYSERFGFSSAVLTAVFALYAFVLVPALMLFGQLSDRLGRRIVLLMGLAAGAAGLIVFAFAESTAWLFAGRVFQGLAVGMASSAATAALVELEPARDARRPALLAGLAQAGGSGAGPLVAGLLAEWAPDPLRLPYVVLLAATAAVALLALGVPEPLRGRSGRWRVTRPGVPADIRRPFARVALTAAVLWAAVALFLSIVPSYAATLLETSNLALLGAITAVMLAASCAAQVVAHHGMTSRRAQQAGVALLALGLAGLVAASPLGSLPLLLAAAVLTGAGHGIGFLYAQDDLNRIAPPDHRGEVTAAFITSIYVGVAGSVISVGLLDTRVSLAVAVGIVAAVLAGVALAAGAWHRYGDATARVLAEGGR
jgi:predicted MFS family arabinose efflux permease